MKKATTTVVFGGTQEQLHALDKVIEAHKGQPGALMPVMQEAQAIYGYLPIEVQKHIAIKMEVPVTEVYGVSTFYSQFALNPKGKVAISICLGTACYVKGSGDLVDKVTELVGVKAGETSADGKYSLDATRCVGACGLAPVVVINEDVYGRLLPKDMAGILAKY